MLLPLTFTLPAHAPTGRSCTRRRNQRMASACVVLRDALRAAQLPPARVLYAEESERGVLSARAVVRTHCGRGHPHTQQAEDGIAF